MRRVNSGKFAVNYNLDGAILQLTTNRRVTSAKAGAKGGNQKMSLRDSTGVKGSNSPVKKSKIRLETEQ